jgi:hypothetical protein
MGKKDRVATVYYGDVLDDSGSVMCEGGLLPLDEKTSQVSYLPSPLKGLRITWDVLDCFVTASRASGFLYLLPPKIPFY